MDAFRTVTAIAAPIAWANVNTDDIFPGPAASPVVRAGNVAAMADRAQMGPNAFAAHRWNDDLSPKSEFILNQPPYDQAGVLVAGENFGCGSSREMAVWCLQAIGIRAVIAQSFGDIFYNNCFKNGLLPVRLERKAVEHLLALVQVPETAQITVDLESQVVTAADGSCYGFDPGAYQRQLLLDGLDEITATLRRLEQITAAEHAYFARRPWLAEGGLVEGGLVEGGLAEGGLVKGALAEGTLGHG
jgi:3-isopropylmalate/(R)-2-methylmalate dehydratase small subunit